MMEAERWALVKRVFKCALDRPEVEREEFVREECGSDAELRAEVESLLSAHAEAGTFAEQPALRWLGWPVDSSAPGRDGPRFEVGSRIGPYEISALIGEGAMGQVWRARHPGLRRDDALKVLPDEFVADPDRLARFRREAQLLASLNHPNIAHVYGLEQGDRVLALVMELVPGETLADRLQVAGKGLPINETLSLARQMTDAIEAAHEQGIVHRDLKPSNIKVRPDGTVKVLDFGLAKALHTDDAADVGEDEAVSFGPVVLGTACYMSPEQARGQDVDRRTDIWAFGCILYEMLTGRRAFDGPTSSDVIARVLEREPDYDALPANTPMLVRRLLRRCLEKDLRRRLRDIADARIDLDDTQHGPPTDSAAVAARPARSRLARSSAVIGISAVILAVGIGAAAWLRPASRGPNERVHMTALLPPGVSIARGPGMLLSLALSPDGRTLVIVGTDATGQRLYRRTLDRLEATPVAGTDGALSPFFSPDGAWVGFFADRRLKRVPVNGGAAVDIAAVAGYPAGASWGNDDRIVYAAGYLSPLRIVNASGGTPETLTKVDAARGHLYPEILPDGRTVLFNEGRWIHALDLASGRRKDRLVEGTSARYSNGYLILNRQTALLAAPFDPTRLEILGPAVPVVEAVAVERGSGGAPHVAVSRGGTVAYVPAARAYVLVLVDVDGAERLLSQDPLLENPQFSPGGDRLVVARTIRAGETPELWMYDLESDTPAFRLTSDGGRAPVWSPDGASITYSHPVPSEKSGIYTRPADGRGNAHQIVRLPNFHWLVGWTPQQTLAYGMMEDVASDGISRSSIVAVERATTRRVIGPGDTWGGRLSPDGRRLAYYSLESGYFQIYVTPFPDTGTQWLIAEGTDPSWSPDGSEIYYRNGSRLMAARIDTKSGVRVIARRPVIDSFSPPLYDDYDIHPNGRTLALVRAVGDAEGREVAWVLNLLEELRSVTRD